jgi:adenylate cyclase class 2
MEKEIILLAYPGMCGVNMEHEIRLKVENFKAAKKFLVRSKAKYINATKQIDKYYGNVDLYTKKKSFLIRIRSEKDVHFLTYKASTGRMGRYEEYETNIKDPKTIETILLKSKFNNIINVTKSRTTYKLGNCKINLDTVKGLGNFIEIEIISDSQKHKELARIVKEMNLNKAKIVRQGYVSIMLACSKSTYAKYING